jgi:hypothetical protein
LALAARRIMVLSPTQSFQVNVVCRVGEVVQVGCLLLPRRDTVIIIVIVTVIGKTTFEIGLRCSGRKVHAGSRGNSGGVGKEVRHLR